MEENVRAIYIMRAFRGYKVGQHFFGCCKVWANRRIRFDLSTINNILTEKIEHYTVYQSFLESSMYSFYFHNERQLDAVVLFSTDGTPNLCIRRYVYLNYLQTYSRHTGLNIVMAIQRQYTNEALYNLVIPNKIRFAEVYLRTYMQYRSMTNKLLIPGCVDVKRESKKVENQVFGWCTSFNEVNVSKTKCQGG